MSSESESPYSPLVEGSSVIRVLILAPGQPDEDIYCWLINVDLDADPARSPHIAQECVARPLSLRATGPDGQVREYKANIDCFLKPRYDGRLALTRHPFQQYTALSYVWGSRDDPRHIILNGRIRFPVTKNLFAALKALRDQSDSSGGTKLWVDALCINQADHKEKEHQLQLMRRVYQQAQDVVAYVPQAPEDEKNLYRLFSEILRAEHEFERYYTPEEDEDGEFFATTVSQLRPPEDGMGYWQIFQLGQHRIHLQRDASNDTLFLENFGLPPENSDLWSSWRRFFASPYCENFPDHCPI